MRWKDRRISTQYLKKRRTGGPGKQVAWYILGLMHCFVAWIFGLTPT